MKADGNIGNIEQLAFYQEVIELIHSSWSDSYANEVSFVVGSTEVQVDGDTSVKFKVKSKNAYANGEKFTLSEKAQVKNGDGTYILQS